jgi:hypothetical protein
MLLQKGRRGRGEKRGGKQADKKGAKHETNGCIQYGQRRLVSTRMMRFDRRMGTEEYSESN